MKDPTQDLFFKEQLVEEEKDLPLQQSRWWIPQKVDGSESVICENLSWLEWRHALGIYFV